MCIRDRICPFNTKPVRYEVPRELAPHAASLDDWEQLLDETEAEYKLRVKVSSLSRVKPAQWRRNLAIALTNALTDAPELGARLKERVQARWETETDDVARAEWARCLTALRPIGN